MLASPRLFVQHGRDAAGTLARKNVIQWPYHSTRLSREHVATQRDDEIMAHSGIYTWGGKQTASDDCAVRTRLFTGHALDELPGDTQVCCNA